MEGGKGTEGALPVARLEEVGHHDDEAAAARDAAQRIHRGGEVGGRRAFLGGIRCPIRRQLVQARE